jgi:ethanolamine utilization protein EutN
MQFARVIGTLVATDKVEGLKGVKFLVVQPLDKYRQPVGEPVIAADGTAQAGPGDLVDHAIAGIVDEVDVL